MNKSAESSKESLIDKIKLKKKVGNISLIFLIMFYFAYTVAKIIIPNFGSMAEFMIFLLLVLIASLILDGYKFIIEALELIKINEDNN